MRTGLTSGLISALTATLPATKYLPLLLTILAACAQVPHNASTDSIESQPFDSPTFTNDQRDLGNLNQDTAQQQPPDFRPEPGHSGKTANAPAKRLIAEPAHGDKPKPIDRNDSTLIIGDSLSTGEAGFGPGLCKNIANAGGLACLFSVSNSYFDQWAQLKNESLGKDRWPLSENRNGSSQWQCASGHGVTQRNDYEDRDKKKPEQEWNLQTLLETGGHGCSNKKFKNLVVQLGTNPCPKGGPTLYIGKMIALAKATGIKNIKFILPPNGYNDPRKFVDLNKQIEDYVASLNESNINISTFNSSLKVSIQAKDFRTYSKNGRLEHDLDHFWNSPSEKDWLDAVSNDLGVGPAGQLLYSSPALVNTYIGH